MQVIINVIIICNQKVLIVQKKSPSGNPKPVWELPGDLMQPSDISVEHAAVRIVKQELNICIMPGKIHFNHKYKNTLTLTLEGWLCDEREAYGLVPNDYCVGVEWCSIDALDNLTPLTKSQTSILLDK